MEKRDLDFQKRKATLSIKLLEELEEKRLRLNRIIESLPDEKEIASLKIEIQSHEQSLSIHSKELAKIKESLNSINFIMISSPLYTISLLCKYRYLALCLYL